MSTASGDWRTHYKSARGSISIGLRNYPVSGEAASHWIEPGGPDAEPGVLLEVDAVSAASLIFFLSDEAANSLHEVDVTLPTGKGDGEQATYQFRPERPLRWLSLGGDERDSSVSSNSRYVITTQRTADGRLEFHAVENENGPGAFPGVQEAHLSLRPSSPRPPWHGISLQFSTSDNGLKTAVGSVVLSEGS